MMGVVVMRSNNRTTMNYIQLKSPVWRKDCKVKGNGRGVILQRRIPVMIPWNNKIGCIVVMPRSMPRYRGFGKLPWNVVPPHQQTMIPHHPYWWSWMMGVMWPSKWPPRYSFRFHAWNRVGSWLWKIFNHRKMVGTYLYLQCTVSLYYYTVSSTVQSTVQDNTPCVCVFTVLFRTIFCFKFDRTPWHCFIYYIYHPISPKSLSSRQLLCLFVYVYMCVFFFWQFHYYYSKIYSKSISDTYFTTRYVCI